MAEAESRTPKVDIAKAKELLVALGNVDKFTVSAGPEETRVRSGKARWGQHRRKVYHETGILRKTEREDEGARAGCSVFNGRDCTKAINNTCVADVSPVARLLAVSRQVRVEATQQKLQRYTAQSEVMRAELMETMAHGGNPRCVYVEEAADARDRLADCLAATRNEFLELFDISCLKDVHIEDPTAQRRVHIRDVVLDASNECRELSSPLEQAKYVMTSSWDDGRKRGLAYQWSNSRGMAMWVRSLSEVQDLNVALSHYRMSLLAAAVGHWRLTLEEVQLVTAVVEPPTAASASLFNVIGQSHDGLIDRQEWQTWNGAEADEEFVAAMRTMRQQPIAKVVTQGGSNSLQLSGRDERVFELLCERGYGTWVSRELERRGAVDSLDLATSMDAPIPAIRRRHSFSELADDDGLAPSPVRAFTRFEGRQPGHSVTAICSRPRVI